jgi:hypothetical protein
MRRAHRNIHVVAWLLLAPIVAAGFLLALNARPDRPYEDIPSDISEEAP